MASPTPTKSSIGVGLIGFGTVGSGVVKLLRQNADLLRRRLGVPIELIKVADLDITRDRGVSLPAGVLTADADEVLAHPAIDVVIELIGGIEPARRYLLTAMARGKHVVTANKALLASAGEELFAAAAAHGVDFEFEGSVGGGIPIIRALKEGLSANRIGWAVEKPRATMFVWAPIPEAFRPLGSLEFAKRLLTDAKVAVSPGIGFGEYGEGYVRIALVENRQRIMQAARNVKRFVASGGRGPAVAEKSAVVS